MELSHDANALRCFPERNISERSAVEGDRSLLNLVDAVKVLQERRLAAAIRAEKRNETIGRKRHIDIVQDLLVLDAEGQIFYANLLHISLRSSCRRQRAAS